MKLPKEKKRYCPYCKKHTTHTVVTQKQRSRSSAHPMSRGSRTRYEMRGQGIGFGNKGRYGSKPAIKSWKRKSKVTKRITILFTCKDCKKSKGIKKAIRTSRIEIGQTVSK